MAFPPPSKFGYSLEHGRPGGRVTDLPNDLAIAQPRARGEVRVRFAHTRDRTQLADLRQAGSSCALFPRTHGASPQLVLTNTSGGVTGGDRFRTSIGLDAGAEVTVTTQAAERAYRAQPSQIGRVETKLQVGTGARLGWLPQETILFDGCAFARRLSVELAADSSVLLVEPVVFGRSAMGETVTTGQFDDRVEVRIDGRLEFVDRTRMSGDIAAALGRPAVGSGARASALIVFAHPAAETRLDAVRALLPQTAGASLVQPGLLVARLLAEDAFVLRQSLVPLIEHLHQDVIPRPWMI